MKVAEEHLDTTKKQLEVAEKQLQIQENTAKYQLSNDEQRCHQTFRLVVGARDATYEWYKDRVKERVEDTCLWFHRHEHFQKWLKQDSGPLLVSADPGCGKSVLAKYLIDHVLPRSATICYFFFKDQDQNTIRQALCAILHQLFSQRPSLIKYAMPRFREDGEKLIHSTKSLWRVFHDATSDPDAGPTIIVLDALDECAESDFGDLVQRVMRQFDRAGEDFHRGSLRYLMTCRPYEQIVSEFNGLLHAFSDIRVPGEEESKAIRKEVDHVITYRVALLKENKKLPGPVATHLERALKAHAHRTYLWIYLVFDHLMRQNLIKTEKGINEIVNTLPENVSQAYEKILNRCDGTERRLVRNALGITLAAARPLKLAELNIALRINMKTNSFDDLDLEENCDFQARLRSACGLFLSVHHDRVYFLHQTAREFLLQHSTEMVTTTTRVTDTSKSWHQSFTMPSAHDILARACVCLLNLPGYHIGILCSSETEAELSHENYGYSSLGADAESFLESRIGQFFSYAAIHWATHFREANVAADATIMSAAVSICDVNTQLFKGWSELSRSYNAGCTVPSQAAASLAVASFHGHVGMVKRLLADGVDVNVRAKSGSPLHLAARKGYEEVVRLLLTHGADANATLQFDHQTPLLDAVCGGNVGIARLLLDHGATVNINAASRTHGPTALPIAVTNGHAPLTALLLERGANIEAQDGYGCTVLQIAIANEDAVLVALLLDRGADTEARDLRGWTTLMAAAADGSASLVELLLEKGANRSAKNSEGQTPRALALEEGHGAVAQML
ncbi:hypothetical protein LMH87_009358 [Akanthomyces muscarius]|uniref:Ankyrin repeat protein n=1 Tax=Akanthomyces muscarius TaxID=2231603 RepID=A0A9W8QB77_AKAMU|nr:hypothetical protein LMH87_009358 [Akanthomyces muscarius]KAJ4152838.1 hypothetical protein LMH87_009358 [Akanthomyces muscarius]